MKKIIYFALAIIVVCSCSKKQKESSTIMATMDTTTTLRTDTASMEQRTSRNQVKWGDATYSVDIERQADKSLPVVSDQQGNHFYDNQVTVVVDGAGGQLMNRTFHKSDFKQYINPQYVQPKHSVLSSIAFKDVSDGTLKLVASVGSPEETDDTYMLVQITIDKQGGCTMKQIDANEE